MFLFVHVRIYVSSGHLGVWGELASHKRSLTHHPSSQGWASGCLELYMFVWLFGSQVSPFFCLSSKAPFTRSL